MVFNTIFNNMSVYIVTVSFIAGGNGSTQKKPLTCSCRKWQTNLSHNAVSITPCLSGIRTHNFSVDRHWSQIIKRQMFLMKFNSKAVKKPYLQNLKTNQRYLITREITIFTTRETIFIKWDVKLGDIGTVHHRVWFRLIVFNATFNNISVLSWRSVLLAKKIWNTINARHPLVQDIG
jgi:hypothetical protein